MRSFLTACGGFLGGVLWMDLMFDVQARGHGTGSEPLPAAALASIAAYYRRVTTDADPMGQLIGVVMVATALGAVWGVTRPRRRRLDWLALLLAGTPIALAVVRVFPNAVLLGTATGTAAEQTALAHAILRDHVLCFVAIAAFIVIQMLPDRRSTSDRSGFDGRL